MINLLEETKEILLSHGKCCEDVEFVIGLDSSVDDCYYWECTGNDVVRTTWNEFAAQADKEYNNGLGGAKVLKFTMIVGKDFWLERHEYDGSEWWEYKELPKPENYREGSIRVFNSDYDFEE